MQCKSCEVELKSVFADGPKIVDGQFEGALEIAFHGGYGMFFDAVGDLFEEQIIRIVICKKCAMDLCDAFPWIAKLLF